MNKTTTQHTPGPWHLNGQPNPTNPQHYTVYAGEPGAHSHVCSIGHQHSDDWQANARLIAGAPDLYDALTELLEVCRTDANDYDTPTQYEAILYAAMAEAGRALAITQPERTTGHETES